MIVRISKKAEENKDSINKNNIGAVVCPKMHRRHHNFLIISLENWLIPWKSCGHTRDKIVFSTSVLLWGQYHQLTLDLMSSIIYQSPPS